MAIISTIGLMALSVVACAGGKNADPAQGSVPTPLPTRVEIENRVASTRGGDKGCEVFHELEEGIAAGAFSGPQGGSKVRMMIIQMSLFVNNAEPPITETVDALLKATERPTTVEEIEQPLADLAKACSDAGY